MNTAKCSQMAEYAMHAVSRATSLSAAGGNSGCLTSWLRGICGGSCVKRVCTGENGGVVCNLYSVLGWDSIGIIIGLDGRAFVA